MLDSEVELPDIGDNIIRTHDGLTFINPNGIAQELYAGMKKHKNKCGQIEAISGIYETFGTMLERSVRVACHLKKLGVTHKDIVMPCTTNHLNTNVVLYAIFFVGAKPACADPGVPQDDKMKQLKLVQPKYVFASPETVEGLEDIIEKLGLNTKIIVFGETEKHISFEEFLVPLPEDEKNFKVYTNNNPFETALIVFSSGTTGHPKGICITHYQLLVGASLTRGILKQNKAESSVYLSYASLVWSSSLMLGIITPLFGNIRLMCSNFEVEKTWKYLENYKVNYAFLAPQDFLSFIRYGKPEGLEVPCLKMIAPVGGGISVETLAEARKIFSKTLVLTAYSQTEIWGGGLFPHLTPTGISEFLSKPNCVGKPMKGFTYKVVDPDTGEILGPNKPGELHIKSKNIMNGYYKADSHDRFDSNGFLRTGDILYYDEDHCFFFVERLKEMLRYKMCAVAPTELEGILLQHPSVEIAVVLGLPSDEGDIITAVVVKSNDNVTVEELENMVASKVDDRKRLRGGVRFLSRSEIPFTPSGKVKRRVLRQYIMEKN